MKNNSSMVERDTLPAALADALVEEEIGDVQSFRRHWGHGKLARAAPMMDALRANGNP